MLACPRRRQVSMGLILYGFVVVGPGSNRHVVSRRCVSSAPGVCAERLTQNACCREGGLVGGGSLKALFERPRTQVVFFILLPVFCVFIIVIIMLLLLLLFRFFIFFSLSFAFCLSFSFSFCCWMMIMIRRGRMVMICVCSCSCSC